ncbi:hypothetical protein BKA70DRAFT_1404345 [Coprinopsis sp. MPI-PUGE-AT-0042]|nr:hypothetical protein BKA70DRAFT_1404345 [Coprinopsis sp. MPI-PUGE-AT-0042]
MYPTRALSPVKDSPLAYATGASLGLHQPLSYWWKVKRGITVGMLAVGSSLWGSHDAHSFKKLLPKVASFTSTMTHWESMETWQIFMDNADVWTHLHRGRLGLLIKRRLPPRNVPGGSFHRKLFKSAAFLVNYTPCFFAFLGVHPSQSVFSFNYVALANPSPLFGRWAAGYICDSAGLINAITPFTALAAILTYAWPYAQSKERMIVLTALDGFRSGVYVSLLTSPIFEFGDTDDVGRRVGMFFIPLNLGVIAVPPISGVTLTASRATALGLTYNEALERRS